MTTIDQTLRRYVETTFLVDLGAGKLSTATNLFEAGVVDSYGVVEMVQFIESEFGVKLTDEELLSPELSSVDGMAALVSRKLAAAGRGAAAAGPAA